MLPLRKYHYPSLYLLIFLSGASGLICQVVWHKYLAIMLGSEARATSIVLAIFLGGIGCGYALLGHLASYKKWNLAAVYALIELGLGAYAFFFPSLFRAINGNDLFSRGLFAMFPFFGDIFLSILLIGVPTFLMGGTLPVLTQGLSKSLSDSSQVHAKIYGFNTVGAFLGAFLAGFILIPSFDFAFCLMLAGLMNLFVAFVIYFGFSKKWVQQYSPTEVQELSASQLNPMQKMLLGVAFCSGFYVLTMETVLIRVFGMAAGSSAYTFSIIVSIFVLGLGIGSLMARKIATYTLKTLVWNQVFILVSFILVFMSSHAWAYFAHLLRVMIRPIPETFYVYQFALALSAYLILAIPVGLCGLTLPICFHLFRQSQDKLARNVGQLYGINTVGCVLGALVGGYGLFYFLDLEGVFRMCLFLVFLSGLVAWAAQGPSPKRTLWPVGSLCLALMAMVFVPDYAWQSRMQPFRHPQKLEVTFKGPRAFYDYLSRGVRLLAKKDGPNSSVMVVEGQSPKGTDRTLLVNGKSDGSAKGDGEVFMRTAHIPALLAAKLKEVAVIGFGTGVTIGDFTLYDEIQSIDVMEISSAVMDFASLFDGYNLMASKNPKVNYHVVDAFRFFAKNSKKYDLIVSEPSNPWVQGVENLFSKEFYQIAKSHLTAKGVLGQWIQGYSFNGELMRMVLGGVKAQFNFVSVFAIGTSDYMIVASQEPLGEGLESVFASRVHKSTALKERLALLGLDSLEKLLLTEVVYNTTSESMIQGAMTHELESPRLSYLASQAMYNQENFKAEEYVRNFPEIYHSESLLSLKEKRDPLPYAQIKNLYQTFCIERVLTKNFPCKDASLKLVSKRLDLLKSNWRSPAFDEKEHHLITQYFNKPSGEKVDEQYLENLENLYTFYKKIYRPHNGFKLDPILDRVQHCLQKTGSADSLHGQCQLARLLISQEHPWKVDLLKASTRDFAKWYQSNAHHFPMGAQYQAAMESARRTISSF